MGCASSMGLGLAIARPERRTVVIDGDGAMLMRMGAVATISSSVDLAAVSSVCGYCGVVRAANESELSRAFSTADVGPTFIHVRTKPRADHELPRPTMKPHEAVDRLRRWLDGGV